MKVSINHQKEDPQAFTTSDGKQKKHSFVRLSQSVERAADVQVRKRAQRRTSWVLRGKARHARRPPPCSIYQGGSDALSPSIFQHSSAVLSFLCELVQCLL